LLDCDSDGELVVVVVDDVGTIDDILSGSIIINDNI
jgi:hypothetical protein